MTPALKESLDLVSGNLPLAVTRARNTNDDDARRIHEKDEGTIHLAAAMIHLHLVAATIHPPTIVEIASEGKIDTRSERKGRRPHPIGGDVKERIPKKGRCPQQKRSDRMKAIWRQYMLRQR